MNQRSPLALSTLFILLALSFSKNLTFSNDGTFTILQLTDLHYGESTYTDEHNIKLQTDLIKRVEPDVVIVTGDVVSGYAYHGQPNFFKNAWINFGKAFLETKVYYAFAMGNHDAQDDTLPEEIFELEKQSEYSLCNLSQHRSHENFNYYLPVHSSLKEDAIAALLWVFNSHSVGCAEDTNSWGCVSESQVQWYKEHSEKIRGEYGKDIHHLGFFHIPFPEYMDLYNEHEFYGHRNEDVSCPLVNTGFFSAIKQEGDIQAVFVGHDHLNDYGGFLDGIELVYGRRMGYAGYGQLLGYQRGARVITLTEKINSEGKITVDREHHVIVEFPEQESQEEREGQKELKKRRGTKQVVCAVGNGESFWLALLWLGLSAGTIIGSAFGVNASIRKWKKHKDRNSKVIKAKRADSGIDDEASGNLAI